MELIEMIGWIVVGFAPMLGGLEIVSKTRKHKGKNELKREIRGELNI